MELQHFDNEMTRRHFLGVLAGAGIAAVAGCSPANRQTAPVESVAPSGPDSPVTEPSAPTTESLADNEKYALHENVTATVFWIGEAADKDNAYIDNVMTAWDEDAAKRFGGPDGSTKPDTGVRAVARDERGIVNDFVPQHNPYYFALPAGEFTETGPIEGARESSPWAGEVVADDESLFKSRWIKATAEDKTVFAQWLDVGPNEEQDYDYVFGDGSQKPANTFGLDAGLDLSPAAAIGLGFDDAGLTVSWQFVDAADVPDGPWKEFPPIDNKTHWS